MSKHLLIFILVFLCCTAGACAQATSLEDKRREMNFLYEIKVIQEFIERFNDDPKSNLRREYARLGKEINFTRRDLINELFEPPALVQNGHIQRFVDRMVDSLHPEFIYFDDTAWYAELQCAFTMDGRALFIPLILQVTTATNGGTKWMIGGIGDAYIFRDEPGATVSLGSSHKATTTLTAIPSSDYATNFLELHNILLPGMAAGNYFLPELLATSRAQKFVQLIHSQRLKFNYPGTMKFYFFQIQDYVMIVERYIRNTNHSGWLISNLSTATNPEKEFRKQKLLQRIN